MAKVFIQDLWLRTADDGTDPSGQAKRSLTHTRDPMKANVPEKWRSSRYGKGGRWRCCWYQAGVQGRGQRTKTFDKLADAEEFQAAMEDDVRRGRYHDPRQENRLFADVAEEWVNSKLDIRPGTLGRYRRELRLYVNPMWGDKPLRSITERGLQEWVKRLSEGGYPTDDDSNARGTKPLAPRSIRNIVRVVTGGVLDYAERRHWITGNPMDNVSTPKITTEDDDMVLLSIGEVEELAEAAQTVKGNPQDALIVRFQAYVGTRIGETFALRVRDMDFGTRRARIRQTWTDDGKGRQMLGLPKNGHQRSVAFPDFLEESLRFQCEGHSADDFVFRANRGGNLWVNTWRTRIWYPALRLAGMEHVRIHDLRHTYASIAIANGTDVKTLQEQLGHASATITLNTYARLWPERLDEVADAVARARASELGS
ncbi:site-specific integrase [Bifidobacterium sp. ESL0775]|uniref:tyrosine-type recombinase/integrase n=1 Tax=Bifidobacterium sp. ESL0775 TaxID=2983230 RepID=UPI0023FA2B95|nr:site-specific integrase [Bifidobacterium sp. ESL0775]WEV68751.1 site-specific integrase [Bifidobacterium sp. ESL0775]